MSEDFSMTISIPSDADGFVLMQCPLCGAFFKVKGEDYNSDDVIELWCPSCGLKSENYFTNEVLSLAKNIAPNKAGEFIEQELKSIERNLSNGLVSIKIESDFTPKSENPLVPLIDALCVESFSCCKRQAKISPTAKLVGSYCPFCGVNER